MIRTLVCVPPGPERDAITALLDALDPFEVVATVETRDAVAAAVREHGPDVLILDEKVAGSETTRLARRLAQERPLPTLLLLDDVSAITEQDDRLFRQLRMYPMPKAGLRLGNDASLSFARTRLLLLASRSKESKTTLDRGAMAGILAELRAEARQSGIGEPAEKLARKPCDVIVVAGARDAHGRTLELLRRVGATRVPVLVSVDGLPDSLDGAAIRARSLDGPVKLRRATGIYLSPPQAHVSLEPDRIVCERGIGRSLAPATVVESTARLGGHALVVDLSPHDRELTLALDNTARRGSGTAWLANGRAPTDAMPARSVPLTMAEVVWLLQQTAPRRA